MITKKYIYLLIFFVGLSACARPEVEVPDASNASSVPADSTATVELYSTESQKYHEAPMLAAMVAAGELPPVDERLPKNPKVLQVYDEIGVYGGTWRRAYSGLSDRWGPTKLIEERIIEFYMWDTDTIVIEPNWADRFEANADSTEFTAHIREGLKWSDGVPVTTEDVRFWYEDILLNPKFFPSPPTTLIVDGELGIVEIVDDYTFIIKFNSSYPLFPTVIASGNPGGLGLGIHDTSFLLPAHYLKQFHPNYTSLSELTDTAADYGVDSWFDLWGYGPIQAWWLNPDLPVLSAWKIQTPPPADQIVMVRNPYYHAVDEAGNQLPYIDQITHDLFEVTDTLSLWATQGLIDVQSRGISSSNYSFFKRSEAAGDYQIVTWRGGATEALYLNLNTPDPVLAVLFNDIRFRQALSVAINREEINEIFYSGLGEVRQASPVTGSPYFDADFEQKWVAYDQELANDLLDGLGLTDRDINGFRLRADGMTLTIKISLSAEPFTDGAHDFVKKYWEAIGVKVELVYLDRATYEDQAKQGLVEVGKWGFDRNVIIPSEPGRYLGTITDGPWAPLYGQWYDSGGELGIEPPAGHPIWQIWEAWENAKSASSAGESNAYVQEMIKIHKENIWIIGLVGELPRLYIVNNQIRNFPADLINDDTLREIGLAQPAQLFFAP